MSNDEEVRQELLRRITARRTSIDTFVRDLRRRSARLSNITIISSTVAAFLTAGPGLGGRSFAQAVQHAFLLQILRLFGECYA